MTNEEIKEKTLELRNKYRCSKTEQEKIDIRNEIFDLNHKLVFIALNKFNFVRRDDEDNISAANIGFINGIDSWCKNNPAVALSTNAFFHIMREVGKNYRKSNISVYIPLLPYIIYQKIKKNIDTDNDIIHNFTDEEINKIEEILTTKDNYDNMIEINNVQKLSLENKDIKKLELKNDIQKLLENVINKKPKKSKSTVMQKYAMDVIQMHFFDEMTERQIAEQLGLTFQAVNLIKYKILRRLKRDDKFREYIKLYRQNY